MKPTYDRTGSERAGQSGSFEVQARRKRTILGAAIVLLASIAPGSALASSTLGPDDHCTKGDAQSIANAFYPRLWRGDPGGNPFADPDANLLCGFRTFLEPPEGICFDEMDIFTGGIVYSEPVGAPGFTELGLSARESVGAFLVDFTVSGPAGAEWETFRTPVKALGNFDDDQLAWRQQGLIFLNTPPGEYQVTSDYEHPAESVFGEFPPDVVTFTVLDHDSAHDLGRPVFGGLEGSVTCPQAVPSTSAG